MSGVDLVQWLRAQLDEDERNVPGLGWDSKEDLSPGCGALFRAIRDDLAVVDVYERALRQDRTSRRAFWLERVVRDMASERADRPGYREEWRP